MFPSSTPTRPEARVSRSALRRAVDALVSFALLEDVSSPPERADDDVPHPHRRRLERPAPARRPGTATRVQRCTAPVRTGRPPARVFDQAA